MKRNTTVLPSKVFFWKILKDDACKKGLHRMALCRCKCGTERFVNRINLIDRRTKSCGCHKKAVHKILAKEKFTGKIPKNFVSLIGKKFGLLLVKKRCKSQGKVDRWKVRYLCICDCGRTIKVDASNLRLNRTISCSCYVSHMKVIDMQNVKPYGTYYSMIQRCYNPNVPRYLYYGGKGIKVCDEWKENSKKFMIWSMEHGYRKGLTLDRIDSSKDYCPENCQWITRGENTKKSHENHSDSS